MRTLEEGGNTVAGFKGEGMMNSGVGLTGQRTRFSFRGVGQILVGLAWDWVTGSGKGGLFCGSDKNKERFGLFVCLFLLQKPQGLLL